MADKLAQSTSGREIPGSNPTGGRIQSLLYGTHFTGPCIITIASSGYNVNNAERDVKEHTTKQTFGGHYTFFSCTCVSVCFTSLVEQSTTELD